MRATLKNHLYWQTALNKTYAKLGRSVDVTIFKTQYIYLNTFTNACFVLITVYINKFNKTIKIF